MTNSMMKMIDNDETNRMFTNITERQKENFRNRMAMLILEKSNPAIKVVFDKEIHPDKLKEVLYKNYQKLTKLHSRNILTAQQWNRLFPSRGCVTVSSNTFDCSLMICLLRNLADVQISDRLPLRTDHSRNADLSRLHHYRNMIFHIDDQFDYFTSDEVLDICIQAIQRLSGIDCNDYKTKLFGDCSKDSRVLIEALLFLYNEGCNLGRIGFSSAFWELTHIDQMGELLCLFVLYKLLELINSNLWKDLTEGKRYCVDVHFLNETFNSGIMQAVLKWGHLPTIFGIYGTLSDVYQYEERRISNLLYLEDKVTNKCKFKNRKSKKKNSQGFETLPTAILALSTISFTGPEVQHTNTRTTYKYCAGERFIPCYIVDAPKGHKMIEISSSSSDHVSCYVKDNEQPLQSSDKDICTLEHKINYVRHEDSKIKNALFDEASFISSRHPQQPDQTACFQILPLLNCNKAHCNNNASNKINSAFDTQYTTSSFSLNYPFSSLEFGGLPSGARNDSQRFCNIGNVSHLSWFVKTNESGRYYNSSNVTGLACYTASGNEVQNYPGTGYCTIT